MALQAGASPAVEIAIQTLRKYESWLFWVDPGPKQYTAVEIAIQILYGDEYSLAVEIAVQTLRKYESWLLGS